MPENGTPIKDELHEVTSILADAGKRKSVSKKIIALAFLFVLALIIVIPMGVKFAVGKYTDKKLTALLDSIKEPCYVIYEKSEYDLFANHLTVSNVSVICMEEEAAKFAVIDFDSIKSGNPFPANISADFKDGVINVDAKIFGHYGKLAAKLGYGPIPVYGNIHLTYNAQLKTFTVDRAEVTAAGIGSVEAQLTVEDVNAATLYGAAQQILLNNYSKLWVSFKDKGFMERTIARYAGTINSDENSAKSRALHGIERRISGMFKDNQKAREQLVQIYRFIEVPSTLTAQSDGTPASIMSVIKALNYAGWRSFVHSIGNTPLTLQAN